MKQILMQYIDISKPPAPWLICYLIFHVKSLFRIFDDLFQKTWVPKSMLATLRFKYAC